MKRTTDLLVDLIENTPEGSGWLQRTARAFLDLDPQDMRTDLALLTTIMRTREAELRIEAAIARMEVERQQIEMERLFRKT